MGLLTEPHGFGLSPPRFTQLQPGSTAGLSVRRFQEALWEPVFNKENAFCTELGLILSSLS